VVLVALRLRTLYRAKNIGSALKSGVDICQRQLINEVLGRLVTEFIRNFGRETRHRFSAAPMGAFSVASKRSNSSDIDALRLSQSAPSALLVDCSAHQVQIGAGNPPRLGTYPPGIAFLQL
jgi:hypothetical protein